VTYVPPSVPPQLTHKVSRLVGDLDLFARIHKVQDKDSKRPISWDTAPMQEKIFAAVEAGHKRIACIKARQVYCTTGCKMVLHHMAYTTPHAAMHAVVSMRADSASMLLDDNRRWLDDPPALLQRPIKTKARNNIVYEDTGASIRSFTSRSATGLRSFTPVAAVISEAAFAPDLEETIAQADAAVGEGLLILESTANAPGDFFSKLITDAASGEGEWHLITMWWWEHPAYTDSPDMIPADFESTLSEEEQKIRVEYNLTLGQLHWRRRKISSIGSKHKFQREYPGCLDDCFLGREGGYYDDEVMQDITVLDHAAIGAHAGREIESPHPHDRYVMGVDIGGGVGGDYSALCVVSVATHQPVYFERSNRVTPADWAHRAVQVASRYNQALMLYESNNHGHAFGLELGYTRYTQQWRDPKGKPWVTTLKSKLDAFDTLREALSAIQVMDRVTWLELRSLTIPPGKVAPEAPKGGYDDAAVAIALAYRCLRDVPSSWRTHAVHSKGVRVDTLLTKARARRIRAAGLPF
jgi:hypothetical protein